MYWEKEVYKQLCCCRSILPIYVNDMSRTINWIAHVLLLTLLWYALLPWNHCQSDLCPFLQPEFELSRHILGILKDTINVLHNLWQHRPKPSYRNPSKYLEHLCDPRLGTLVWKLHISAASLCSGTPIGSGAARELCCKPENIDSVILEDFKQISLDLPVSKLHGKF